MTHLQFAMSQKHRGEVLGGLQADNIFVERGGIALFKPISFALGGGDALLIEGRNGIGKTSLLKAIGGLAPLAGGLVHAHGLSETSLAENLHYLGHDNGFRPQMTAEETAAFHAAYFEGTADISEVFARLGLSGLEDIPAGYLSAGQKRKLSISRLLLSPRALWLLDEPLNALDVQAQALMHRLIDEHRSLGGMVIAVSHGSLIMPGTQRIELDERTGAAE